MSQGFYGFPNILGLLRATAFRAIGKTGATAGAALAGGTTGGAPTSGQFDAGDAVVDQTGKWWLCTTSGSPGSWSQVSGNVTNPMTAEGSLIQGAAGGIPTELALGTTGQGPTPVGSDVAWATPPSPGGLLDPTTADGQLLYRQTTALSSVSIGGIGDSIMGGLTITTPPLTTLATLLSINGITVSAYNQGQSGATSADWLPGAGSGYLTAAKTAFASAGVRLVLYQIGANDSKTAVATSATTYAANVLATCQNLVAAGYLVALVYPSYLSATTGQWEAASPGRVVAYAAQLDALPNNGTIFLADTTALAYFKNNPGALNPDVHPSQAGSDVMAGLWATNVRHLVAQLTGQTTLQPLTLGTHLSITSGVLNASASTTLAGLTDTSISAPADGAVLRYSTADGLWHNVSPLSTMHWDLLTDGNSNIIYAAGDTIGVGTLN